MWSSTSYQPTAIGFFGPQALQQAYGKGGSSFDYGYSGGDNFSAEAVVPTMAVVALDATEAAAIATMVAMAMITTVATVVSMRSIPTMVAMIVQFAPGGTINNPGPDSSTMVHPLVF